MIPAWTYRVAGVVSVYDGDTVALKVDLGFKVSIQGTFRLAGIDAPELRGETKEAGIAARDRLRMLMDSSPLVVRTSKSDGQEKYGRWLEIEPQTGEVSTLRSNHDSILFIVL